MSAAARSWLVPEVVQTSGMDCGPAALKALLGGFGVPVSYGRLREVCQTDVDGTSIDSLEQVAGQLGLDVEQAMVPADHLFLPEASSLPALVVVYLPSGLTHFVVVWRVHLLGGPFDGRGVAQVMDPGAGRRWVPLESLRDELFVHSLPVPAAAWREHAASPPFRAPLARRLRRLGVSSPDALIDDAAADPSWRSLGALDAATRLTTSLARSGALRPGAECEGVLKSFARDALDALVAGAGTAENPVPERFWSVRAANPPAADRDGDEETVSMVGAVVLRANGRRAAGAARSEEALPPEVVAALREVDDAPLRQLWRVLRADGALGPAALAAALAVAATAALAESVLFRALFELARRLGSGPQRVAGLAAVLLFLAAVLALEFPLQLSLQRVGRRLENRLRVAFLEKIPKLGDRYFQSRPMFDMTERGHAVHQLRALPALAGQLLRAASALAVTALGVAYLAPGLALPVLGAVLLSVLVPLAAQRPLAELDLRYRSHAGALGRYYLDALLGLSAVRTHGAERAIRREHESLLLEWARAARTMQRASVGLEGVEHLVGVGLSLALLLGPFSASVQSGSVLLLAYWALSIPALGAEVSQLARQVPDHRAVTARLLEPLGAPEDDSASASPGDHRAPGPAAVAFDGVSVVASGHTLLEGITAEIPAGAHVAVVGSSGAGKSSLVGLLLGWHAPSSGAVMVDGEALRGEKLASLRSETAWVDPAVQLWNRSLLDNLRYGTAHDPGRDFGSALRLADLRPVLERLPDGLQTPLGEGGALVSGGEGQRVRFARGLLRPGVRLAILDEPFRGLDREKRRELLARAREHWRGATLLCVTHDVGETRSFPRVLVIEGGRLVEDGDPGELAARPGSRYRALLDAEDAVRSGLWSDPSWRRLRLEGGRLREGPGAAGVDP